MWLIIGFRVCVSVCECSKGHRSIISSLFHRLRIVLKRSRGIPATDGFHPTKTARFPSDEDVKLPRSPQIQNKSPEREWKNEQAKKVSVWLERRLCLSFLSLPLSLRGERTRGERKGESRFSQMRPAGEPTHMLTHTRHTRAHIDSRTHTRTNLAY